MIHRRRAYDVVIVGGGVIGMFIAYRLSKAKDLSIALVDKKRRGNATMASAGGLWAVSESVGTGCDVIIYRAYCERMLRQNPNAELPDTPHTAPECFVDYNVKSCQLFRPTLEELKRDHGLDFHLIEGGMKFIIFDDVDARFAEQIMTRFPRFRHDMRLLNADELRCAEPVITQEARGALEFMPDALVNPWRLLRCLREGAQQNGVDVYLETTVTGVDVLGGRVHSVRTDTGPLHCGEMINAGGAWASEISEMATGKPIPVIPVKGQVVLTERLPRKLNSCISSGTAYIAQVDHGEMFLGSTFETKGYDTTVTLPELREICDGSVRCIPALRKVRIKRTWAGLRPGTPDDLPILGPVPGVKGYLNAAGLFRVGIAASAMTAELLNAIVRHKEPVLDISPYLAERFDPGAHSPYRESMVFRKSSEGYSCRRNIQHDCQP